MRTELKENGGLSKKLLVTMSIVAGISVANLYYNQPLLNMIKEELNVSDFLSNMIAMVSQMDDRYRAPLELKLQGYQVKEIATILNITQENVKVRIFRARKMILDKLESYHEQERD